MIRFPPAIKVVSLAAIAASVTFVSLSKLVALAPLVHGRFEADREVLYLPSGRALKAASFGYDNVVANVLWFQTVSYFGKHFRTDRSYVWLAHMCNLVSDLTPRAMHVYQFCSNMLSWEANNPRASVEFLSKGIAANPTDWHLPYFRGVTYLFFLKDNERARDDFVAASKLPGADPIIKRLAAKTLAEQQGPDTAISFLEEMIAAERDPNARKIMGDRLAEIMRMQRRPSAPELKK